MPVPNAPQERAEDRSEGMGRRRLEGGPPRGVPWEEGKGLRRGSELWAQKTLEGLRVGVNVHFEVASKTPDDSGEVALRFLQL